jgi:peptidoglycan/LPS O-acetylase OafA/YrhL
MQGKTSSGEFGDKASGTYYPAIDGIRALAVMAVMLYHAGPGVLPGGFLGVEVFFVLSGYLITSLLASERARTGTVDLVDFWRRRARRLFPALILVLVATSIWTVWFLPDEAASLRGDFMSTLGYLNNWYQVFSHKSYFELAGRPCLLKHMWSLAVEEQFYLVWPPVFAVLCRDLRRQDLVPLLLAGACLSTAGMALFYQPETDPSRLYYGTDTRAAGLLLGSALALFRRPGWHEGMAPGWKAELAGITALGLLVACFLWLDEFNGLLYRGGFSLVEAASLGLIVATANPRSRFAGRWLSWGPWRWIGVRSYGLYLWHFPIFAVTRPQLDLQASEATVFIIRMAATFMLAALSYRFVEKPVRDGALGRLWECYRGASGQRKQVLALRWTTALVMIVVTVAVPGCLIITAQPPAPVVPHEQVKPVTRPVVASHRPAPLPLALPGPRIAATNGPASAAELAVTAIGDSVMEGVAGELGKTLGAETVIDTEQGRQAPQALTVIRKLRTGGNLNPVVVLHIGANGIFTRSMFDRIMDELKAARKVIILNVKAPRNWEGPNNRMLAGAISSYPQAELLDWHTLSTGHPEWFWKDGIHVKPQGARIYADLVNDAVKRARQAR